MDKYRRNDDMNDDLGVYNQETYPGMSIFDTQSTPQQPLHVIGKAKTDVEFNRQFNQSLDKLSGQEQKLVNILLARKISVRQAAKLMGISQQMAQKYWSRIQSKLQSR